MLLIPLQHVFAHYRGIYNTPYAADMQLRLVNRRVTPEQTGTLQFRTSGRVRGVSTARTTYVSCTLNAAGNCGAIPQGPLGRRRPDPTAGVTPVASLSDDDLRAAAFVTLPAVGKDPTTQPFGTMYGFRKCMEGKRLAKIESMHCSTIWVRCLL